MKNSREMITQRIVLELKNGDAVNLGIGLPGQDIVITKRAYFPCRRLKWQK